MTPPARLQRLVCAPAKRIADRLLSGIRMRQHLREARRILDTPPIMARQDGVVLLSMIGSRVLLPYLVAIKSFHHHLGMGRIVLIDDGTLTAADRAILDHHCGSPEIVPIATLDTGACPRGGTWERLLMLLDRRARDYVIQLDSDTVTIGDVPEIRAAIAANRNFILLGDPASEAVGIQSLPDFVAWKYPGGPIPAPAHMQALIESRYGDYPDAARHRYVRASSGFAGFARGGPGDRAEATTFSRHAEHLVGQPVWWRWGSEQVTSNFLLANEPGSRLLPYARYYNYWLQPASDDARFIHFVGTHRYSDQSYIRATRRAIDTLTAAARRSPA
ncbi:hypothetical protein RN629_00500 [Sphingomonadaceae bacterium jetA1]|jgi:hypothetical protein|uniref:hypothetical protein n=1 Tax=Facivitalis istanbulensis TaxID=3075838 RepID=UPI0034931AD6